MKKLAWAGVVLWIVLCGCGADEAPTRPNDFTPLTSIEIIAASPRIARLTSAPLTAVGNFSGLFTRDITGEVLWTSTAPLVADFTSAASPGRVSGLTPGVAMLTATLDEVTASFELTVTAAAITRLDIAPKVPTLPKGLTTQFSARGDFSDSTTQDLTFDAQWSSSNPAVATVSNAVDSKGLAKALTVGPTTIAATFGGESVDTELTVIDPVLESIEVTPAEITLLSVATGNFQATGHYSDDSIRDLTTQATWTASVPEIATVVGGVATTLRQGTTVLRATYDGVSDTSQLRVSGGDLTAIAVTPATPSLIRENRSRMTAQGSFSNGTSREITGMVDWTTADPAGAAISAPGGNLAWLQPLKVTPYQAPNRITARIGNISGEAWLTVTAPSLNSNGLTLTPANADISVGTSGRFMLSGAFNDGSIHDLTLAADWNSSAATFATVGTGDLNAGRVSGDAERSLPVTISATYGDQTATAPVTVTRRTLQNLLLSAPPATIVSGAELHLTATAVYTDGFSQDVTEDVVWSSARPTVVRLSDEYNSPGNVVAIVPGTAVVTAKLDSTTQSVTLTVGP